MAIFHLSVEPISRSKGRSATAAAAYRAGAKIVDERTGETHDYSRKRGIETSQVITPPGAPSWASDQAKLWNAAEQAERRSNARVAREIDVALPAELDDQARAELTAAYAARLVDRYQTAAHLSIHTPSKRGDKRNHHVHILIPTRSLTSDGFGPKIRTLDDRDTGPLEVEWMRETWAKECNAALERARVSARIDHRSFTRQGIDRVPTRHVGPKHTALARRGVVLRPARRNQVIEMINRLKARAARALDAAIVAAKAELADLNDMARTAATAVMTPSPQPAVADGPAVERELSEVERRAREQREREEADRWWLENAALFEDLDKPAEAQPQRVLSPEPVKPPAPDRPAPSLDDELSPAQLWQLSQRGRGR